MRLEAASITCSDGATLSKGEAAKRRHVRAAAAEGRRRRKREYQALLEQVADLEQMNSLLLDELHKIRKLADEGDAAAAAHASPFIVETQPYIQAIPAVDGPMGLVGPAGPPGPYVVAYARPIGQGQYAISRVVTQLPVQPATLQRKALVDVSVGNQVGGTFTHQTKNMAAPGLSNYIGQPCWMPQPILQQRCGAPFPPPSLSVRLSEHGNGVAAETRPSSKNPSTLEAVGGTGEAHVARGECNHAPVQAAMQIKQKDAPDLSTPTISTPEAVHGRPTLQPVAATPASCRALDSTPRAMCTSTSASTGARPPPPTMWSDVEDVSFARSRSVGPIGAPVRPQQMFLPVNGSWQSRHGPVMLSRGADWSAVSHTPASEPQSSASRLCGPELRNENTTKVLVQVDTSQALGVNKQQLHAAVPATATPRMLSVPVTPKRKPSEQLPSNGSKGTCTAPTGTGTAVESEHAEGACTQPKDAAAVDDTRTLDGVSKLLPLPDCPASPMVPSASTAAAAQQDQPDLLEDWLLPSEGQQANEWDDIMHSYLSADGTCTDQELL